MDEHHYRKEILVVRQSEMRKVVLVKLGFVQWQKVQNT